MSVLPGRQTFKVFGQEFVVDERYTVTKELGQGAYGIVCSALNNLTQESVAIKKLTNVFSKKILAKRALREIKLLQHFRGHRNVSGQCHGSDRHSLDCRLPACMIWTSPGQTTLTKHTSTKAS